MNNLIRIPLALLILALTTYCSNGGRTYSKTPKCPSNFSADDLDNNQKFSNKLNLKPGEPLGLSSADYAYLSFNLKYIDEAADIQLAFSNSADSNDVNVTCSNGRGISANTEPIELEIPLVSDLFINSEGASFIRRRTFKFKWKVGEFPEKKIETVDTEYTPGSPILDQPAFENNDVYFMTSAITPNNYELVAKMDRQLAGDDRRSAKLLVQLSVGLKTVTEDERKIIDESLAKTVNETKTKK